MKGFWYNGGKMEKEKRKRKETEKMENSWDYLCAVSQVQWQHDYNG